MKKFIEKIISGITVLPNGVKVVVASPHPVNFFHSESSENKFAVQGSGFLISARPSEKVVGSHGSVQFIRTVFQSDPEVEAALKDFKKNFPDVLIVGSVIAAQAYPGLVVGLVPEPGFERVPPEQKRMSMMRFNLF